MPDGWTLPLPPLDLGPRKARSRSTVPGTKDNPLIQPGPGGAPVGARDVPESADKNRFWNEESNVAPYNAPGAEDDRTQGMASGGHVGFAEGGGDTADDWTVPAEPKVATAPADHDDWTVPETAAAPITPQWSKENPYVAKPAKSDEEYQAQFSGLPGGTFVKTPAGELMRTPPPKPAEAPIDETTGQPVNYKAGLEPAVRDTGILGAVPAGLYGAGKGLVATGKAVVGQKPDYEEPDLLAAQPMEWRDFLNPSTLTKKFLYQFAESSPTMAAAIFGGAAGTALAGGPEDPIAWGTGLAGTAVGAALGSTLQSLGTNFAQALDESKGDGEAAWNLALKRTGVGAAGSAASFSLFNVAPFSNTVKNTLFQAFGLQPAAAAAERAAGNIVEGKPAGEGVVESIPGAVIGTAAPMAAHHALSHIAGRGEAPETAAAETPATAAVPQAATGLPNIGETIGMPMGESGVQPMTVARTTPDGDVVLTDAEGTEHRMTAGDVARLRADIPAAQASAAAKEVPHAETPPPAGASPAAQAGQAAPAESVAGAPPQGATPPSAAEPIQVTAPSEFAPPAEAQPRTLEDIERESAQERATRPEEIAAATERQKLLAMAGVPTPEAAIPGTPQAEIQRDMAADRAEIASAPPEGAPGQRTEMTDNTTGQKYVITPNRGGGFDIDAGPLGILYAKTYQGAVDQVRSISANPGAAHAPPEMPATPVRPVEPPETIAPPAAAEPGFHGTSEPATAEVTPAEPPLAAVPEPTPPLAASIEQTPVETAVAPPLVEPVASPSTGNESLTPGELRAGNPTGAQETPPARNEPFVTDEQHTKTGNDIYAVRFPTKPDIEGLGAQAKKLGGYWSSFRGGGMRQGWMFKTRENADEFATWARGQIEPSDQIDEEAAINRQIDQDTAAYRALHGGAAPGENLWTKSGREITVPNFGKSRTRLAAWLVAEAQKEEPPASETRWLADSIREMDPKNLSRDDAALLRETLFGNEAGPGPENRRPPETPAPPPAETTPTPAPEPAASKKAPIDEWADSLIKTFRQYGTDTARDAYDEMVKKRRLSEKTATSLRGKFQALMTPEEMDAVRNGRDPPPPAVTEPEVAPTRGTHPAEEIAADVEQARVQTAEPTPAQAEAGNYAKGRVSFHGLPFTIETPAGAERHGIDAEGKPWTARMPDGVDYGEIRRTQGMDGDPVDMFLGPDHDSQKVWVVDQLHADTGKADEHKVLAGFPDEAAARAAYEASFSDGRGAERIGAITPMSLDEMKGWLKNGNTQEPVAAHEPVPVRDLGPPLAPRSARVNTAAPTESALVSSLNRADETRNRPRLSPEQKIEAENVRRETALRFDDALDAVRESPIGDWAQKAANIAERQYPAAPGKEPTASRKLQRRGFMDEVNGRSVWGTERDYMQGRREARKWIEENPKPDVGTIGVDVTTARGRTTKLEIPRDRATIERVKEQYTKLEPELLYGLAQRGELPSTYEDRLADYREFAGDRTDAHQAARDYVVDRGKATGHEYTAAVDPAGRVEHALTSNYADGSLFSPELLEAINRPGADLTLHHYHPGDLALSGTDIEQLAYPGASWVIAHGPGGDFSGARLNPALKDALSVRNAASKFAALEDFYSAATERAISRLRTLVGNRVIAPEDAEKVMPELANRGLASGGVIDYQGSRDYGSLNIGLARNIIRDVGGHVRSMAKDSGLLEDESDGDSAIRDRRSAERVQFDRAVEAFPRDDEAPGDVAPGRLRGARDDLAGGIGVARPEAERQGRTAVDAGQQEILGSDVPERPDEVQPNSGLETGTGEPAGPEGLPAGQPGGKAENPASGAGIGEPPEGRGLAEEAPHDFSTRATEDAVEQAGPPRDTPGWFDRLTNKLGVGPKSPGRGDHFFNAVNKDLTAPMAKARIDPRSAPKMQAELAKKRDAAELLHGYKDGLASWQGKPLEAWRKQFAAMELLTLDGREMPLDGRAIIVENKDRPLAGLSKPGDVIRLTTPEEIGMFSDYRNVMDKVWKDLVAETAHQFGWTGEPTAAAIYRAAEGAGHAETAQGRRLLRAAKIVAAIEAQHRDAYLPLMRQGDYFMRVKAKPGTPDKPGIPGDPGTGGYPPTVMFKLIDSLTPSERAVGGIREGTPGRATEELAELRKTFPEAEYDIDHGYMFRSADAVKDLDVPAIDKLMMLVSNDARGQMRDRLERTGMERDQAGEAAQADYEKLVDTVLDRIYEERVAGFKRQRTGVAGYGTDFAKATGQYTNWLSSHISSLRHAAEIDAADQAIDNHPDPRTRAFWRDWDRRQESYGDQLHGPLAALRNGAFYTLLGMNAATTAKIMLHGPLRGVPILTTGLGAQGRARAIGDYIKASKDVGSALRIGKNGIEVDFNAPNFQRTLSAPERALIDDSLKKGILHQQTADELGAIQHQGEEALTPQASFRRRTLNIWGSNVSAADRMVRGSMLLSAYRVADRVGMDAINKVWNKDLLWRAAPVKTPETFAQHLVDQTVGVWGDLNRMPIARSALGGMLMQFRQYETGYLGNLHSMMWRMGPEGKVTAAMMLGGLGMLGGAAALPFVQDAEKAVDAVYKMIAGIDPDVEASLKHSIDALSPGMGETFLHGAKPGGIDWGGVGFGDIASRNIQSPLDLAGAAVSTFAGGPYRAWERYNTGQEPLAAAREMMPNAIKNFIGALYPEAAVTSAATGTRVLNPDQISEADRAKMGLGFQPEARALKYEQIRESARLRDSYTNAVTLAENRIANLLARGESDQARAALADAAAMIGRGESQGVFTANEVTQFRRQLAGKLQQRLAPEVGSRTQQRITATQQAQP